jgi:hypothetical protein
MSAWAHAHAGVRLKIGREMLASYAAITGVSAGDSDLSELYKLNVGRLPKAGNPEELSNGVILGATELGGAFCKKALDREVAQSPGQRMLFGSVNFKRGPSQFGDFLKGKFLDEMAVAFWQRNITEAEKTKLSDVMNKTIEKDEDTPENTVSLMQVMCTSYATSLAFLVK